MSEKNIYKPDNKLILKNTIVLYLRQILTLFVSLYTVRVVLDVLGVQDYGIYSVVGGVVSFFSFLKGAMSSATQRFFSFALGKDDKNDLDKVFSINITIYFFIAVTSLVLLEVFGLWFVKNQLSVPADRLDSAIFIFHFSVFTFFFNIISSPFIAAILSHEDMSIYAYISLLEVVFKLLIAIILPFLLFDKLELYGVLTFIASFLVCSIYLIICLRKYSECQLKKFFWEKKMFVEIMSFTGWTMFGQLSNAFRYQAILILINQFFSPVVVAANAIARNISMQIQLFSNNFNTSLYPPIIKSYANNDMKNMFSLVFNGCKITFFLMWIFALPFYLEMETILGLWLKDIPEYSILFTRLCLIEILIGSISLPIATAARAPGRMKWYELILGLIQIGIFLFSWIALKAGGEAYIVFVIAILANILMFFIRLFFIRNLIGFPILKYLKKVVVPVLVIVFFSVLPSFGIKILLPNGYLYSFINILSSFLLITVIVYQFGLNVLWKSKVNDMIKKKFLKFNN